MKRLIFINSHPIQYIAPLYQKMAQSSNIDFEVWYCSKFGLEGEIDRQFGKSIKWDIPLLEGYSYKFLKNNSKRRDLKGFWSLINLEVICSLFSGPKKTIIVHGWAYFTNVLVILLGKLSGNMICLRGESPLNQELKKKKWYLVFRKLFFKFFFFKLVDKFLYIGEQNKQFYLFYGVADKDLIFTPYSVDNKRFRTAYNDLKDQKNILRKKLGIPLDKVVVLYCGKFISKKKPMDLLKAFSFIDHSKAALIFMGEGNLRSKMENYIEKHQLPHVYLTGFINQSKIVEYYAAADFFVMCSQSGETWGLAVNEAMNFGLPIITADIVGSASDLIIEEKNGFIFQSGMIQELASYLKVLVDMDETQRNQMGNYSLQVINRYSYDEIIKNISQLDSVYPQ